MTSTPSRLSEASTTSRMCSGLLVRARHPAVFDVEAELGGDHHLFAHGLQRLADDLLVGERAIDLGRVEECLAALDRLADQRDAFFPAHRIAIGEVQAHAAETYGRDLQSACSEFTLLHRLSMCSIIIIRGGI